MKTIARPKPELCWASPVGEGFELQIRVTLNDLTYQVVTIVADELDESLWVEVNAGATVVQIPLSVVRDALDQAVGQVHSESWYDRLPPPAGEV